MPWAEILGHDTIVQRFHRSFKNNRLANTYLFVGREGIGKRKFALKLAQTLFCENRSQDFEACGNCPKCIQLTSGTHPDLIPISKPAEKNFLPVELFVGDREHRRRAGLCHEINLTPFSTDRKIAIIDDADFFNAESANSLLKILEEPPNNSLLILIGTSEHRQLPTILSRCQLVRFQPLAASQVTQILQGLEFEQSIPDDQLVEIAAGSVSRAVELNDEGLFEFRKRLLAQLSTLDPANQDFAKAFCDFVDGKSKDSAVKRRSMNLLAEFAIQFFTDALHFALASDSSADSHERELVQRLVDSDQSGKLTDMLADCIERTMLFQRHVDSNMAMANIVPSWLNDLGALARGERQLEQSFARI